MKKNVQEATELLKELGNLLTERISDLHDIKLGKEARHAFLLYRKYVWDIQSKLSRETE